jgi:aminoacrylate hydrolase
MPAVSLDDAEIHYEEQGAGPPLLLVPGLSGLGSFWAKQVADLARDFRVVVHDHRGAGRSSHSRIRYSVEQMAADVLGLMDRLDIDAAHLVGHSTGGAIGQVIAQDHPERLRRLVLSATWAGPDPFFRRCFAARKDVLLHQGMEAYVRASALTLYPPLWISAHDEAVEAHVRGAMLNPSPVEVVASRIDAIVRYDRRARLSEIAAPALVIVAADDMITPVFYSEELAGKIPAATLRVLDTGGHFAPVIAADTYNSAVGAFLRGA